MVTGVETAGLVLAVLPLLIEALSAYRDGLEKAGIVLGFKQKRCKLKINRLRLQLENQKALLHLNLVRLIGRAAPDADFVNLPEDYNDGLWKGETADKIKAYLQLGGIFEAFEGTPSLYESYLEEIADKPVDIFRPPKADRSDLKALLEANRPDQGRYSFSQRLGFVMNEASIDDLVKRMRESTLTLQNIVDGNEELYQIQRANEEPQQARQNRTANSLHKKHATQENISWRETSILTSDEDNSQLARHTTARSSAQKSVSWSAAPDIIVTSSQVPPREDSAPVEVTSICKTLAEVQPPMLQLSSDNRLFWRTVLPDTFSASLQPGERTMSLEVFLREQKQLDPEDRIKLGVNLASSLLQYNLTPWLQRCWTKNAVHFFIQTRAVSGVDIEHPLIMRHFSDQTSEMTNERPENDPELALMELGILLLEIWTLRTFESWIESAGRCIDVQDRYNRLIYSVQWFQSLKGKLLPNYQKVVGICLRPSVFDLFNTSWEDKDFRTAVYCEIVEPLLIWSS